MSWRVTSSRLAWAVGTVLGADDLAGCNIGALVQGGHLEPVTKSKRTPPVQVPDDPQTKKAKPVEPVTEDNSADELEEQE